MLALFTPGVHYATVVFGLRILLSLLKHDNLMQKFKEGSANGGWLTDADSFVRNRTAVMSYCACQIVSVDLCNKIYKIASK